MIIFKIPDSEEVNKDVRNFVLTLLRKTNKNILDADIISVSKIGTKIGNRPTMVRFANQQAKSSIFRNMAEVKDFEIVAPILASCPYFGPSYPGSGVKIWPDSSIYK